MALIFIYKGRGITKYITLQTEAGVTVTPGSGDKIRVRIGREGKLDTSPLLEISSDGATANGSTFTKNTPESGQNTLDITASDADLLSAGVYTAAFDLYDSADSDWKNISRQVLSVEGT